MTSDGIKPFNYKYEETEPYEKGFASHYLRNVVPAILEVREKQARTVKLARRGRNLAIGVALLLALAFGAIDVETVERLPGHVGILVIGSFLVVGGLFEAFANLPGRQFRDRLKTRVIPQIISFFGPYQYAYTKWADSWLDRFEGEYEGRFFRFAEIEETSSMNDDGHRSVIFDGVTLHVAIPRVPCTTRIHQDRGRYDDPRKETGQIACYIDRTYRVLATHAMGAS